MYALRTAVDEPEQLGHAEPAHFTEVLPYGGERWSEVRRLGNVVEADQTYVAGYANASLVQRPHRSKCHVIVPREDRGHVAAIE